MITSEILGKLGGAEVEVTPVEGSISGKGRNMLLHTVEVPEGETVLVAILCSGTLSVSFSTFPYVSVGTMQTTQSELDRIRAVEIIESTSDIRFHSVANGTSSFTGHVYTVKV